MSCVHKRSYQEAAPSIVEINENKIKPKVTDVNSRENTYGPSAKDTEYSKEKLEIENDSTVREPIIVLDLAPALYSSIAYIEVLSQLDKKNIRVKVIVSSGFTSVVAALYAKYQNANRVNFKLFSLFPIIKGYKPFSSSWIRRMNDFIDEEFGDVKQESLTGLLAIPSYKDEKLKLNYTGRLSKNLKAALQVVGNKNNFLLRPNQNYLHLVEKLGVDLVYRISAYGKETTLLSGSGFLLGMFSKLKGYAISERNNFRSLGIKETHIDKIGNTIDISSRVRTKVKEALGEIEELITDWKSDRNRVEKR